MTLRLTRYDKQVPIVDVPGGTPSLQFIRVDQSVKEAIEAQEATQDALIAQLAATVARIRRLGSHTLPTTILKATEDGTDVTIEVLDHTRVYADGTTLSITGGVQAGAFLPDTEYACYYDDTTLLDTTPTFVITDDPTQAPAAAAEGRHFCGFILTPALASGDTIESGGAYAAGTSLYGELGALL